MSEFRQDPTSGRWTLVAPERGRRPHQTEVRREVDDRLPGFDPACPFCPGNEHMLPDIVEETASDAPPGWRTRVVPNRYPAVRPDPVPAANRPEPGPTVPGYGYHEVIVETGRHDADLATLDDPDLGALLQTYRSRYAVLMARPAVNAVVVFRNRGRRAGASLVHPHSQVLASALVPPRLAAAADWARSQHARHGRCVVCDVVERELESGRRIVEATPNFLALVPFAASAPFEQWLVPRGHAPSFANPGSTDLLELGRLLQRCVRRLAAAAGDPSYRLAVQSAPKQGAEAPWAHWLLRIVPGLAMPGGFELAAGLPIIPSRPEDDAEALRGAAPGDGAA